MSDELSTTVYRLHEYPAGEPTDNRRAVATCRWAWPLSIRWTVRGWFAPTGTRFSISPSPTERTWRLLEIHGEWTDDEWERVSTLVCDLAHGRKFPKGTDPYVSGRNLTEPPDWAQAKT